MGTWGPGLYANDLARDLKPTVAAVANLPFDGSRLTEILIEAYSGPAGDQEDEEHTTFWLVLADQLHRKGIEAPEVYSRAIEIVESGEDLRMQERLDVSAADRKKRAKALEKLVGELRAPLASKPRKTLKAPQPLLMAVGDVYVFPINEHGGCVNPYAATGKFEAVDWGAAIVVAAGHAFGYLAYYVPIVVDRRMHAESKPTLEELLDFEPWRLERPGTCSKTHFQRMRLEKVAELAIDPERVKSSFPAMRDGRYQAVNDISISNSFSVQEGPRYGPDQTIVARPRDLLKS
jgi:hypothetical protein